MAFPSLVPNEISFTQGRANLSEYQAFGVGPVRFRHSSFVNDQQLVLTYRGLNQTSINLIRAHYNSVGGTHGSFTAPTAIWGGVGLAQTDSTYRYAETPTEEHTGLHYNVTITLRLLRGVESSFILDGGPATLPAESAFSQFVFVGTAPFILNGTTEAAATLILDATQTR